MTTCCYKTRYYKDMLPLGRVIIRTCYYKNMLSWGHVTIRMCYNNDMLLWGHVILETCYYEDMLLWGHSLKLNLHGAPCSQMLHIKMVVINNRFMNGQVSTIGLSQQVPQQFFFPWRTILCKTLSKSRCLWVWMKRRLRSLRR